MSTLQLIIDDIPKFISALTGLMTVFLMWRVAIPKLDQIHTQTNNLAARAEAGAHAQGVQEGMKQAVQESVKQALGANTEVAKVAAEALSVAANAAAEMVIAKAEPKR